MSTLAAPPKPKRVPLIAPHPPTGRPGILDDATAPEDEPLKAISGSRIIHGTASFSEHLNAIR